MKQWGQLYRTNAAVATEREREMFLSNYGCLHVMAYEFGYRIEDLVRDRLLSHYQVGDRRTRPVIGQEVRTAFFASLNELDDMIYDIDHQNMSIRPNRNLQDLFIRFDDTANRLLAWISPASDDHNLGDFRRQDFEWMVNTVTTLAIILFRVKKHQRIELVIQGESQN